VIGVQAEGAPAMRETWRTGEFVTTERVDTYADGLATRAAWSLPMQILWRRLDDFLLVSDAELRRATLTLLETTRQLAEGAGAAATAGAWRLREDLAGRKVAVVLSGGNLTLDALAQALAEERPW
jgi:threonine dehydratase